MRSIHFPRSQRSVLWLLGAVVALSVLSAFVLLDPAVVPAEYVRWMRDPMNGQYAEKQQGKARYAIQFKPREYVALVERHADPAHPLAFDSTVAAVEDRCDLYTLTITGLSQREPMREGLTADVDYFQRTAYYALDMERDLFMVQGTDTLPPLFAHTERSYGVGPDLNMLVAFPKADPQGPPMQLLVNDRALSSGVVVLPLDVTARTRIPQLKNR
jgi:hypothetical protein